MEEAFHKSVTEHGTVAESIQTLAQNQAQCQVCGKATISRCKGCQLIRYCSIDCQTKDWTAGHNEECAVIQDALPWTAFVDEIMAGAPSAGSVVGRHAARIASSLPDQLIGRPFRGGGGFRGGGFGGLRGGFGGGGMRGMGRAPVFRSPIGTARLGLRGPGYSSRSLFSPVLGHRWGRGLGFGGYRWGYWGGWRFPWVYAYGLWYPWWFYLDPLYYRMRRPYIDPVTGVEYGIPPSPPGAWGPVGAPPQGLSGYASPPSVPLGGGPYTGDYAPVLGELVTTEENATTDGVEEIGTPLSEKVKRLVEKGRGRGRRKFSQQVMYHTIAEMDKGDLNIVTRQWAARVAQVSGPALRLLNDAFNMTVSTTGYKKADVLLTEILSRHFATLSDASSFSSSVLRGDKFAVEWSGFWAVLSIDPVWLTLNASGKSTLEEVIASAPRAAEARRTFLVDAQMHTALVAAYLRGVNNREACLDAAQAMGEHMDQYLAHKHSAIAFSVAELQQAWSQKGADVQQVAAQVMSELDTKK